MTHDATTGRAYSQHYQDPDTVNWYESTVYKPGGHDDVLWSSEQRLLRKLILRHRPNPSQDAAMDFACGTGRVTGFLHGNRGALVGSLVGVDISPAMLERARPKVGDTELICADIVNHPGDVPGNKDIITSFRFLLFAELKLREAVVGELAKKLRDEKSVLIFSLHGNPYSYRALANLRNRFRGREPLLAFGLGDLRRLADRVGLRIVDFAGTGYLPRSISSRLPFGASTAIERLLADRPLLRRFGSNLLVACQRV